MKRSKSVVLTSIMASGGLTLAACDATPLGAASSTWLNPPAAVATQKPEGRSYASLDACRAANEAPDDQCATALAEAEAQAPKFSDQQSCEERYGVDQCVPRNQGGGSFFTPLLTGFLVGQALNNFGGRGYYGNRFDNRDGGYYGSGGRGGRDYVTGRSDRYEAPARAQSRSSVISRGGFGGGGGRGYGG
ncbi:DUF1190 domain-containing protein [Phenylobacterium sp.]|uniref:DUF1190 domain-containing protein n=1 Tax=Phenylobacterium sp. TaxID=1871053 RepID=UPI0039837CD7